MYLCYGPMKGSTSISSLGEYFYDNQSSGERSISRYRLAESPERVNTTHALHEAQPPRHTPGILGWLSADPRLFSWVLLPTRSAADEAVGGVSARTGRELRQACVCECRPTTRAGCVSGWPGGAVDLLVGRATDRHQAD